MFDVIIFFFFLLEHCLEDKIFANNNGYFKAVQFGKTCLVTDILAKKTLIKNSMRLMSE